MESLNQGVMKVLNITKGDMIQMFDSIYSDTEKEPWKWVEDFLSDYIVDEELEYIQMYHLSRRLDGTDIHVNQNLKQLLLESSPLSMFFRKYKVTFTDNEGHIDMYYKGMIQPLHNEYLYDRGNMYYLRSRLSYNKVQDFCVNGFVFRSHLEQNSYFSTLAYCPELVQNIEWLLNIDGMAREYYENSKYYCIEYLIPLSEVIFDMNYTPDSIQEKTRVFLEKAILRLYDNWRDGSFVCDDNLILRLSDDAEIKPEWFVNAEQLNY